MGNFFTKQDPILLKYHKSDPNVAKGSYELFAALSAMSPLICTEMKYAHPFTDEVEEDVKYIVNRYPESIHTEIGFMRMRFCVTPLQIAILNPDVPISLIEWLLEHGAHPNLFYNENLHKRIHLFSDTFYKISKERQDAIEAILLTYNEYKSH